MPSLRRQRDPEGRMSLATTSASCATASPSAIVAIVIGGVVGWIYYDRRHQRR